MTYLFIGCKNDQIRLDDRIIERYGNELLKKSPFVNLTSAFIEEEGIEREGMRGTTDGDTMQKGLDLGFETYVVIRLLMKKHPIDIVTLLH